MQTVPLCLFSEFAEGINTVSTETLLVVDFGFGSEETEAEEQGGILSFIPTSALLLIESEDDEDGEVGLS
jgi:hypothetical protein